jgi:hypothetical protein
MVEVAVAFEPAEVVDNFVDMLEDCTAQKLGLEMGRVDMVLAVAVEVEGMR